MTKQANPTKKQIDQVLAEQGWDVSMLYSIAAGEDDPAALCLSSAKEASEQIAYARKIAAERIEEAEFDRWVAGL